MDMNVCCNYEFLFALDEKSRELIVCTTLSAAAEDDKVLVKHIGQSFRFSAVEVLYNIFSPIYSW